jgi:NADH:ubiquinone oxidoreductase subunit H
VGQRLTYAVVGQLRASLQHLVYPVCLGLSER